MSNLILLLILLCIHLHVMLVEVNAQTYNNDIIRDECVERSQREFNKMRKEMKIIVNGRQLGYYGFRNSANAVILLDVSHTNVQISRLNISFTNLIKLHASHNGLEKIDDVGNETFPSLKFLNLSHNAISSVKSHVFSHLSEIEVLDLSHNCLIHFNYDHVLVQHENIKKIYLNDNLLHKFHGSAGVNHQLHLEFMDLSHNFIEEFSNNHIAIKELKLNENSLKNLLIHYADEMMLEARHNNITAITSDGSFKVLDLAYNRIEYLSQIAIKSAQNLCLSHNEIHAWTEKYFSTESDYDETSNETSTRINTEILDLSFNNLTSVHHLYIYENAISINLQSNQLKNLDIEEIRDKFPYLKYLNFIDNPLTDVDVSELKYHNETRFLNLQIDYEAVTKIPHLTLPPLLVLPPISSVLLKKHDIQEAASESTENLIHLEKSNSAASPRTIQRFYIFPSTESNTETSFNKFTSILRENEINNLNEWHSKHPPMWLWIFGTILITASIISLIYFTKRLCDIRTRLMKREFNEAENFLL